MEKHHVPLYKTCQMFLCGLSYRLVINNVFVASNRKDYMNNINSRWILGIKSFIYLLSYRCIVEGVKLIAFMLLLLFSCC